MSICCLTTSPGVSISAEQNAVIVSGRVPDSDASRLLPIVDEVDHKLNSVRAKYPGYKIGVTGTVGDRGSKQRAHDR